MHKIIKNNIYSKSSKIRLIAYSLGILLCCFTPKTKSEIKTNDVIANLKINSSKNNVAESKNKNRLLSNNLQAIFYPYTKLGTRIFNNTSITFDSFIPIFGANTNLFFSNIKIDYHINKTVDGGVYLGFRYQPSEKQKLYGIYTSLDFKKSQYNKDYFTQITTGLELWIEHWFLGCKIHNPIGKTKNTYEHAISKIGVEAGYEFSYKSSVYLEGYYLNTAATDKSPGVKIKFKQNLFSKNATSKMLDKVNLDQINLEIGIQKDKLNENYLFAELNFKIGGPPKHHALEGIAAHMTDTISRNEIATENNLNNKNYNIIKGGGTKNVNPENKNTRNKNPESENPKRIREVIKINCLFDVNNTLIEHQSNSLCPEKYLKEDQEIFYTESKDHLGSFWATYNKIIYWSPTPF